MTGPGDRLRATLEELGAPPGSVPARRAADALASLGEGPPARRSLLGLVRRIVRRIVGRLRRLPGHLNRLLL